MLHSCTTSHVLVSLACLCPHLGHRFQASQGMLVGIPTWMDSATMKYNLKYLSRRFRNLESFRMYMYVRRCISMSWRMACCVRFHLLCTGFGALSCQVVFLVWFCSLYLSAFLCKCKLLGRKATGWLTSVKSHVSSSSWINFVCVV